MVEWTKGFSYAQLNELYTSVALQWHYEKHVDLESIYLNLQADNKKKKNQAWDTEEEADSVGFVGY
ncbi:hypothetical protein P4637_07415 [Halalkalibacterium halodurans]|uniref:Uncharacterized protein n=1 Tax=Halalkalibacterium halodurans TaxID=86665 RepID=A0A0M0KJ68_ALKHA|nr:hypothetical protein [Halalkalibacterium halodurans]MED4080241.1 hypothetical protein [Halalkalibacterium halodurans]MED4084691.1 hypothetical protein [Halalkalibacterium halodurans]MED4103929.1 hypothetical protein [Halalkalibacterium halodurans]MED4108999.1 hypothetical protein [Halalkalibacterium halodurans]MED4150185.1 hypothetical protein [Halalkalibacterium halodurans]